MGSGTTMGALLVASRPKAGSATGLAGQHGVEGGSRGTEGGGVEGGSGAEGGKLGQPDGANQNFTVISVLCRRGSSPYIRYVIGIADIVQPMQKM
jgi:hypothetical protein